MPSPLQRIARELRIISRELTGLVHNVGIWWQEPYLEFLQDVDDQIGLEPRSRRMLKHPTDDSEEFVYETVNGDKIWATGDDEVFEAVPEFGKEYDEPYFWLQTHEGHKIKFTIGDDKPYKELGIKQTFNEWRRS